MEAPFCGGMDLRWLQLRWPMTALALGGMAFTWLMRLSHQPIQVHLVHSFAEPLRLGGQVQGLLQMPEGVRIEPSRQVEVKVLEHAPIGLSVTNKTPVQVQVSNPNPIQLRVDEPQPMRLEVTPQAPVKVKLGL